MFYNVFVRVIRVLIFILNGRIDVQNKEHLPDDTTYILAAPHRSWLDPVYIAVAALPHVYSTMAKQELFENSFVSWLIYKMHGFPVNREKPGPSAIKQPVSILKKGERNILIFSTGSRYDDTVKGGTSTIARMANVPIVPVVYQGPFSFWELLKRKKGHVRFGKPIYLPKDVRLSREELAEIDQQIHQEFSVLDKEINPDFTFEYKKRTRKNRAE